MLAGGSIVAVAPWSQGHASETIFTGKTDGVAINVYDSVDYFRHNAPVKRSDEFTADYEGVKLGFVSEENRDLLVANPEKYAPQYGGYCAYAAANNSIAKTKPEAFTIADGYWPDLKSQ